MQPSFRDKHREGERARLREWQILRGDDRSLRTLWRRACARCVTLPRDNEDTKESASMQFLPSGFRASSHPGEAEVASIQDDVSDEAIQTRARDESLAAARAAEIASETPAPGASSSCAAHPRCTCI